MTLYGAYFRIEITTPILAKRDHCSSLRAIADREKGEH